MKLRTVSYFLRQAAKSTRRNGWMSLASVATVAIALFVLGAFLLVIMNANYIAQELEASIEIAVYLQVDTPREKSISLKDEIARLPQVAEVVLVTKEEALDQLSKRWGDNKDLLAAVGGVNPLPDYFRVKAVDPNQVQELANLMAGMDLVEKVDFGAGAVTRLLSLLTWVRMVGLVTMALVSLAAIFLIAITVRLTVFARRREIAIAKWVGASDWFVRWPFFLEGVFLGLAGALVSILALYGTYTLLVDSVANIVPFLPIITDIQSVGRMLFLLLAAGVCVGAVGSAVSVHRFLRV
ncbi:MAG: permease-like cell division protein FtsX [Syntrophomonadaceae bacterium]|nr:permease-like cell division protein FtsX [Syntrophomonadaceae bacterium]